MTNHTESRLIAAVKYHNNFVVRVSVGDNLSTHTMPAQVLLNYAKFREYVLFATGELFRHPAEDGAGAKKAWLEAVSVALDAGQREM